MLLGKWITVAPKRISEFDGMMILRLIRILIGNQD
jgi:hypothetical protein